MDAAHGRETGVWEGIWLWTSVAFWEGRRVEGSCARHRLAPSSLRRLSTILAFMVTAMRSVKLSTPRADRSENHNLGHPRPPPPLFSFCHFELLPPPSASFPLTSVPLPLSIVPRFHLSLLGHPPPPHHPTLLPLVGSQKMQSGSDVSRYCVICESRVRGSQAF